MFTKQPVSWKPRSFQLEGIKLGVSQACAGLLFPPGGGKTSTMYMIFRILQEGKYVDKMLVICPLRPAYNVWPRQKDAYLEFQHLRVAVLHGPGKEERLWDDNYDIYVVNPEGLDWLFGVGRDGKLNPARVKSLKARFGMLCVDESTKFKNSQTKRFKLLKLFVPYFKRRYILTGTPTPAGLLDLFGQVYILDEGASLGRYITHYRNKFFYPSGFGGYDWTPAPDAAERIGRLIAPLTLRVDLKEAGVKLPELVFDDIYVDLPPAVRKQYQAMEDEMYALIESEAIVADNAAVASSKCRQIANGILIDTEANEYHEVHDEKLDALGDLLEQLQGDPVLITYEFTPDRDRIMERFKIPCISTGNVRKDDAVIQQFKAGLLPAVCGQPQSVSLGIDGLQDNCKHIAMFGVTWRLQDYLQVIDRVRRQGNPNAMVFLHRILARNTVDERVLKVLDNREADQESFMQLLKTLRASGESLA